MIRKSEQQPADIGKVILFPLLGGLAPGIGVGMEVELVELEGDDGW